MHHTPQHAWNGEKDDERHILKHKNQLQTERNKFSSDPRVGVDHKEPPEWHEKKKDHHHAVKRSHEILKKGWWEDLALPEKYSAYHDEFANMQSQFENKWYKHLCSIKPVHYRVELWITNNLPIFWGPYSEGPRAKDLGNLDIHWMLPKDVIKPDQRE